MVYDEDPRRAMNYPIESDDRADTDIPMEPPKSEAIRYLILEFLDRFPDLPAERIHERIRRVLNRHDVTMAEIYYVFEERRRTLIPGVVGDVAYPYPMTGREGPGTEP
jgi:hypothetical protein